MAKKLVYGSQEIRLSDDQDITALRVGIAESMNAWEKVTDNANVVHWLLITPGIPVVISDSADRKRSTGRVITT